MLDPEIDPELTKDEPLDYFSSTPTQRIPSKKFLGIDC